MSGLGYRSDLGACVPTGGRKLCSFCERNKPYREVRYYYDTISDMFCYVCDACVTLLIKKGLEERDERRLVGRAESTVPQEAGSD